MWMGGQKPWGGTCLNIYSSGPRHLWEIPGKALCPAWVLGEERVVMEAVAVAAGGDSEGKCVQPCGATLGVCGEA
jgi:hypothetical protein